MCGFNFGRGRVCPGCGEELTEDTVTIFGAILVELSLVGFPIPLYILGARSLVALIGCPIALYLVSGLLSFWMLPRKIVVKRSEFRFKR